MKMTRSYSYPDNMTLNEDCFCKESNCRNIRSQFSETYCQQHQISNNICYIAQIRNPVFKGRDLLNYKLIRVLSKIQEEVEDEENWILNYNEHLSTLKKFNELLFKATGYRLDSSQLEGSDIFIELDGLLTDYAYETRAEGCVERNIVMLSWNDQLLDYLNSI